jgi:NADH-quinone oxidoreductase subunit J
MPGFLPFALSSAAAALPQWVAAAAAPSTVPATAPAAAGDPGVSPALLTTFGPLLPPVLILILCAAAAVATVLLLPGRREATIRRVGGALLLVVGVIFAALLFRTAAGSPGQGPNYYFWPFAAVAVGSAVRVVTHPRPVYSALYFVLTTFASAGLFVLLWAEFMAAALILIYAGAILVTYVFVIMLAQQATGAGTTTAAVTEYDTVSREPVAAATVGFGLMAVLLFVVMDKAAPIAPVVEGGAQTAKLIAAGESTQSVGRHLFEHHLVNLELAGLILTLATVGAIVIARRKVFVGGALVTAGGPTLTGPGTPVDDDPHSIPVYGTDNPRQKAYPET